MSRVLHLLTGGDDAGLALAVVDQQRSVGDDVTVALLPGASAPALPAGVAAPRVPAELSWEALLERIFEADQVITW
jgi:hypothetical protein